MVQDKLAQARQRKEPQRAAAADNKAVWADLDGPEVKGIRTACKICR